MRQVVTWLQTKFGSGIGLYVLTDYREMHIYWMLLALAAVVYVTGFLVGRSRLGFAMRVIGNDETVARHVGIDTARSKVILFVISGAFIGVVGAILAPRFSYIQPPSAFDPMISFQVVIMALLGGTKRLWGPLLGGHPLHHPVRPDQRLLPEPYQPDDRHSLHGDRLSAAARRARPVGGPDQVAQARPHRRRRREGGTMTAPALSVVAARRLFGGLVAVNDVSFEVRRGELLGLIGPNGTSSPGR